MQQLIDHKRHHTHCIKPAVNGLSDRDGHVILTDGKQ
jgi:hypothetical protein